MSDITVRRATGADDLYTIASCIYLTDPYIYPAAFGDDPRQAARAITRLMGIPDGLFHPDHIALALREDQICGIILYIKDGARWNGEECAGLVQGIVPDMENFRFTSDVYFSAAAAVPPEKHIELVACCVMPECRGMGIGRKMLDWLTGEFPGYAFTLDVLAGNPAAIRLYEKCGFTVSSRDRGFHLEESLRPDCYRMIRK